jgi:predicted phage terminase large subunit-like protein
MQRGHQEDLAAILIESGNYVHLNLPTEYVPTPWVSVTGWSDPRTKVGELLNPVRFGEEENERAKTELGPIDYSAQHGQDPLPESGGMFERGWFEIIEPNQIPGELGISSMDWADQHLQITAPGGKLKVCRGWDAAGTEGDGDWTVGALVGISKSNIVYILDIMREQVAENEAMMMQAAKLDGSKVRIREEQEGGSGGKKIILLHKKMFVGYNYAGERATGEKHTRWKTLASYARPAKGETYGNVKIVRAHWNKTLLDEFVAGRRSKHDDQLDAVSLAFNEITLGPGKIRQRKARWG